MVEEANFTFSELLKSAVEAKLKNAELYDIASYGWLNENDPDPEYIGHAMWQIDAPAIDDQALFEDRPVQRRPKEIEKEIQEQVKENKKDWKEIHPDFTEELQAE